ncbi:chaperone NapD [Ferrimonas aestuarii]|uniref:Chaperone NapD n=1 Tax=Ferrimonas aestuarii TaxID=2569539 RepID=A0A4U1BHF7_9GAMM|nr:chaperone NapD [Ferrimonas aestuarii]TKB50707.1 sorbose reductase [Ferrimonas aestuarii]
MSQDYQVVSLVVHAKAEKQGQIEQEIAQIAGAEVVTATDDHKLIVTIEGESRQAVLNGIEAVNQTEGVISSALAYHQVDPLETQEPS